MTDYRDDYKNMKIVQLASEKRKLNKLPITDEVSDRIWAIDFWLTSKKEPIHTPLKNIV